MGVRELHERVSDFIRAAPGELALVAVLAAVVLTGSAYVLGKSSNQAPPPIQKTTAESSQKKVEERFVVHVAGLVASPGVYELTSGSRIKDAIDAAGGPVEGADLDSLNLAERLTDGAKIFVGKIGQPEPGAEPQDDTAAPQPFASPGGRKISLNQATQVQLEELPGVGPVTAQRILDYRRQKGTFTSVRQLLEVEGIGPKKYEAIKDFVSI